ncbi:MAG: MarR family transcriptional regulator [Methanomicrobiaceae archaeon]|nr:MarR family transcriptional regulator [Methanomicrobiaceae archaeon]
MDKMLPIVALRECTVFIHTWMSVLLRTEMGKKGMFSPVALGILYMAYFHKIRMKDISERFNVSASTATDYVNNLEKNGFVKRVRGEDDRRDIYIVPEKKGEKWILERETEIFSFLDKRLAVLEPSEQKTFLSLLAKFTGYGDGKDHDILLMNMVNEAAKEGTAAAEKEGGGYERVEEMVKRVYGQKNPYITKGGFESVERKDM